MPPLVFAMAPSTPVVVFHPRWLAAALPWADRDLAIRFWAALVTVEYLPQVVLPVWA